MLLAAVGPVLAGIQPNSGALLPLDGTGVRDIAPKELRFRFDENQQIDSATLSGIRIIRSNMDATFGGVAVTDFNTAATAKPVTVQFTAVNNDDQNISLLFTKSDHLTTGKAAGPIITVAGTTVSVDLDTNAVKPTTADQLVTAINANLSAAAVLTAAIASGKPDANIAAPVINYSPLRLVSNDVLVTPSTTTGYMAVADAPNQNEVIVRFAETLPNDWYRIELFGVDDPTRGLTALRNTRAQAFEDTTDDNVDNGLRRQVVDFRLALGPQVVAVVPQPITRIPDPANSRNTILSQSRNQIVVYFNNDDLFIEHDAANQPTVRSADHPHFYRLILTRDTVQNTDDVTILPQKVDYDPIANTATLTFAQNLDELQDPVHPGTLLGPGTFRLRVGTNEALPSPPIAPPTQSSVAQASSDFGTGNAVTLVFTAVADFAQSVNLNFSQAALGVDVASVPKPPTVTVSGQDVQIVLNTSGTRTTANQLAAALQSAAAKLLTVSVTGTGSTPITGSTVQRLRLVGLGSSFDTASELGQLTAQNLLLASSIDAQVFPVDLPGGQDEPGHRVVSATLGDGFEQHVNPAFGPSQAPGLTTILYNFRQIYGVDSRGQSLTNAISEKQKQRVREAVQLWSQQLGVQFLETADQGLTFVTGDPVALDPNDPTVINHAGLAGGGTNYGFIVRVDPTYANGMVIMDSQRRWNEDYGGDWFTRAMVGIGFTLGLGRANDLPPSNLMSFDNVETYAESLDSFFNKAGGNVPDPEPIFPGNADILHGQYLHPPTSNDIDLYRFEINLNDQNLDEPKHGLFTAEVFAQRQPNASLLDAVLSLYQEVPMTDKNGVVTGSNRQLIARNDDYYGTDSFVSLDLTSGTYYLGVTSKGNTNFDPTIEDTGFGGTTEGSYQVRLNFRPQVDENDVIRDLDRAAENRPGTALDGDADGVPGGIYNFWFQTRPLQRTIQVTDDGNRYVDGQTLTLTDGAGQVRRFEFDQVSLGNGLVDPTATRIPFDVGVVATLPAGLAMTLGNAINAAGFGVNATAVGAALQLRGDRVTALSPDTQGVQLLGKTIFVDKTSGSNLDGSLAKPFDNLSVALAAAVPGDIVRIEGNGGADGNPLTLKDNFAYEIGFGLSGGTPVLTDGDTMAVPQGVTVMIDAGAIFKLRRSSIGVGSSSLSVDHSGGSLQVLGTPQQSVYFTSWLDETIGRDTYLPPTTPGAGDWGGLVFRADLDKAESRYNAEDQGIFLNYVNHADIRYGGSGQVVIDGVQQIVTPIEVFGMRPTVTFNSITKSADSAISADPDSFEETNFHAPRYQLANPFTSDYQRVGPEIHNNSLIGNSINGLFIRIQTPAGTEVKTLTVSARFDDTDITHVIAENLAIEGTVGVPLLDETRPEIDLVSVAAGTGGQVPVGTYAYKVVFVDRNGFEGRPSEVTQGATLTAPGSIGLDYLPTIPAGSDYVARQIYRSQWNTALNQFGPFGLVAQINPSDSSFVDRIQAATQLLERDPPSVRGLAPFVVRSVAITPASPPGISPGDYNYRVVLVDASGQPGPASDATLDVTVPPAVDATHVVVVDIAGLPTTPTGFRQRIYRSDVGGVGPYKLVAKSVRGRRL